MSLPQFWTLVGFGERFDAWMAQESPSKDLQRTVGEWIVSRYEDPYQGVERQYEIAPNLWFGQIPGTLHNETVVVCGYWIAELQRVVRCDSLASLSLPV